MTTVYDERVHEYQLHAKRLLFAQLQQLTTARYPLTSLYFHFIDEDGDRCRITNEAELREAIRVCGSHTSPSSSPSSLPLPSSTSEAASPTQLSSHSSSSSSPSPLPILSPSPHPQPSPSQPYPSIDDYLSSDEEDVWEQARSQLRQGGEEEEEHSGKEWGVVVLGQ